MQRLIWVVFIGGMVAAFYFGGPQGRLIYLVAGGLIIAIFRRPLVIALTHFASRFGMMREVIESMPSAIHLVPADRPTDAARPILDALLASKFIHAGSFGIEEMPKIQVSLMVQPEQGMLAAVESVPTIGAHLNVHTLYPDGQVVSFTNSELPPARRLRPKVSRTQLPRSPPAALVTRARNQRPSTPFRRISAEEAPRVYEQLYAEETRFQKAAV